MTWAPEGAEWVAWAKPVLFAGMVPNDPTTGAVADWRAVDLGWAPPASEHTAIVADLPGAEAVVLGLALAARGYRPVPLYNANTGPQPLVDLEPIVRALQVGAGELRDIRVRDEAPPAFLLDSERMKHREPPQPGKFDNRWVVFPQDFPSANYLRSRGVGRAVVVLRGGGTPAEDLSHVLYRWQQGGIQLLLVDLGAPGRPREFTVKRPSWFRTAWYRAIATMGLRRNNAGGFGAVIPIPTSSG
ncbi:MAG: hypothetical protein ACREON_09850 [Gemmatimonadaceae bacterium]